MTLLPSLVVSDGRTGDEDARFSESQIVLILKEAENGRKVKDFCRVHGISTACFYQRRAKYG